LKKIKNVYFFPKQEEISLKGFYGAHFSFAVDRKLPLCYNLKTCFKVIYFSLQVRVNQQKRVLVFGR